jgi:hypothetical protein
VISGPPSEYLNHEQIAAEAGSLCVKPPFESAVFTCQAVEVRTLTSIKR